MEHQKEINFYNTLLNAIVIYLKKTQDVERIILAFILFFIVALILPKFITDFFSLPSKYQDLSYKPWTLVTYGFIHFRFVHLFFNSLILFYIGNIFNDFFNDNKLYLYFIVGSVVGGVMFLIYNMLQITQPFAYLIGASAGISAIATGLVIKVPHYNIYIRFVGFVKYWILYVIWIAITIIGLFTFQAGASVAHLGGLFAGLLLTYSHFQLNFKNKKTKTSFKKVYVNAKAPKVKKSYRNQMQLQQEIDTILDKISRNGYDSLSEAEKDFLKQQKD